jgi:hypothetical protein
MSEQVQSLQFGHLKLLACAHGGCASVVVLNAEAEAQARRLHSTFYCPSGHGNVFNGPTEAERKLKAQLEAAERLRFEAERRAADEERERLRVQRERDEARRTLRRGLKVAAHVVSEEKSARGAKKKRGRGA